MTSFIFTLLMLRKDGVETHFIPSGATKKAGGYRPLPSDLVTTKPSDVKKVPNGLSNPRYGKFQFGTVVIGYILTDDKVYVDANRDGDYTNDPAVEWKPRNGVYFGSATVDIKRSAPVKVSFYHFDETQRPQLKSKLLYYGDFGYDVTLSIGSLKSTSAVQGEITPETSLWIDRNGDGHQSYFHEMVQIGKPFNFTGKTYVLKLQSGSLSLDKSATELPLEPMPPVLTDGHDVLTFNAQKLDGTAVEFPSAYKGKVVLLDFWATWCGPCMNEMPNVVKNYNEFHDKGFEILGVTFDDKGAEAKLKDVTTKNGMSWSQIYEGKGWETTLGKQFDVAAIPFSLLIDGTTGKIIASGDEIRGEGLKSALTKALIK